MSEGPDTRVNPYPGLRPFHAEETHLFFGRDHQRTELLGRLRRSRFLAVVGSSGGGKSSLVRAGLLPGLYGGFMAGGSSRWRVVDTRPGGEPIGNLARALDREGALGDGPATDPQWSFTEATLRRSASGLVEVVKEARLHDSERVLVLVDQFEELFRFIDSVHDTSAFNDASAFVKLLLQASRQSEIPIYVVLTMRSDFLGDCARFRDLPETLNDAQYLIPRLTRDQRREAIVGPAAVHGAKLSPALVNRLLNDAGDNPDQLPIMQHALMRTWDYWKQRVPAGAMVELADYEAIGGMDHALSWHAQSVLDGLGEGSTDEQAKRKRMIAEKLFKCLTEQSAHGQWVRRLVQLRDVAEVAGVHPEEVAWVADEFRKEGNAFLMPPYGDPLTPDTYLDISHESLIRNWSTLRRWTSDEGRSANTYRRLAQIAALYPEQEDLLEGRRLRAALEWRNEQQPIRAWAARYKRDFARTMKFLSDSGDARIRLVRIRRCFIVGVLVSILTSVMLFMQDNAETIIESDLRREANDTLLEAYKAWKKGLDSDGVDATHARADLQEKLKLLRNKLTPKHKHVADEIEGLMPEAPDGLVEMTEQDQNLLDVLQAGSEDKRDKSRNKLATGTAHRDVADDYIETRASRSGYWLRIIASDKIPEKLEKLGKLPSFISELGKWSLLVLCLAAWRWHHLRRPLAQAATQKVVVIWRTGAAITDFVIGCLLGGCASVVAGVPVTISLGLRRGSMDDVAEGEMVKILLFFVVFIAYLLFRDAIKFRVHRSIGKILFGLRPATLSGAPMGLKISAKNNAVWTLVLLLVGTILTWMISQILTRFEKITGEAPSPEVVETLGTWLEEIWWTFMAPSVGLLVIYVGLWLIMATFGARRTLDDRLAGTRIVDIRAQSDDFMENTVSR